MLKLMAAGLTHVRDVLGFCSELTPLQSQCSISMGFSTKYLAESPSSLKSMLSPVFEALFQLYTQECDDV